MASRSRGWLAIAAVVTAGLVLSFALTERYHHRVLTLVFLWATMGLAWNIISGYAGQISFGHQAFFGDSYSNVWKFIMKLHRLVSDVNSGGIGAGYCKTCRFPFISPAKCCHLVMIF